MPPVARALLVDAFDAAAQMPAHPHLKDKARMQEAIARTCIRHGQLALAKALIPGIANWRRGVVAAELAVAAAEEDLEVIARKCLDSAVAIDRSIAADPEGQSWHRGRIRARVALAYEKLGDSQAANKFGGGVADSEAAPIVLEKARALTDSSFEAQIAGFNAVMANGNMDQQVNAARIGIALLERCYGEVVRRSRVEDRLRELALRLPPQLSVGVLGDVAAVKASSGDEQGAHRLIGEIREMMAGFRLHKEDKLKLRAGLALVLKKSGRTDLALDELNDALSFFQDERDDIAPMFRADGLIPVAAGFVACGAAASAAAVYRMALDEGSANPNARPRLDDLVAISLSMVESGFEPPEAMAKRMAEVRRGLRAPW